MEKSTETLYSVDSKRAIGVRWPDLKKQPTTVSSCTDPILTARLEAIKQLASGVSERVAVMDRDFNVIYANESAWSEDAVSIVRPPGEVL